jgi:uncharacterized protein (TIRG00374 family)
LNKILSRAIRIVVSVALLVWVLRGVDLATLKQKLASAHLGWLFAAFLVNTIANVFGAWRWQLLLRSQGRNIGLPRLFGTYFVGLFFNNFLPSTIGGDIVRATDARKQGGGTLTENITVIFVERLIGLLATLALGGLAALTGVASRIDPRISWALGGALVISLLGLELALHPRFRRRALSWNEKIPIAFVRRTIEKMLGAFELFSQSRPALVANFILSLAFQFLLIVHYWLIQFAFGEHLSLSTFIVVVPLVFCVIILPIGINGLGVRESVFVTLLSRAGMDPASALALSLASYVIAVGQGIMGFGVHLWRQVRDPSSSTSTAGGEPA